MKVEYETFHTGKHEYWKSGKLYGKLTLKMQHMMYGWIIK